MACRYVASLAVACPQARLKEEGALSASPKEIQFRIGRLLCWRVPVLSCLPPSPSGATRYSTVGEGLQYRVSSRLTFAGCILATGIHTADNTPTHIGGSSVLITASHSASFFKQAI